MSYSSEQIALQQQVWDFCISKGIPAYGAAGILGNVSQESSWDINAIESGNGIGFGLFQWSYTRRTQLESYGTDLQHQLDFLWCELSGENLASVGADLQWFNASGYSYSSFMEGSYSPSESASAFCWCWERPNVNYANISYRQSESEIFYNQFSGSSGGTTDGAKVENAVLWLIDIANDETHGYDQDNRWSPDYDCSSFVISGFEQAGIPLKSNGATYTGNMKSVCLDIGFKEVAWGGDTANLLRGDIILNEIHHVCCYIGNGQIVQASINELGSTTGGQTGDQTGKEIYVRDYYLYSHGWDCVLRLGDGALTGGAVIGGGDGGKGGVPLDSDFDGAYFDKFEEYFTKYDDLSEVYKKLQTTPYIFNQLSSDYIKFLKTLNFNDSVHMKFTFNHNKKQVGYNFLGNRLTFDNKGYKIKDVRTSGEIVLSNGGSSCYNYIKPNLLYQTSDEYDATKAINVAKIKAHIKQELEDAQKALEENGGV